MSLKTISPLVVVDPMRERSSLKIQTIEDDTSMDGNDFYQSLHRHSILHRLVLSRPLPRYLSLDTWYRIDLEVVNELGLPLKGERNASCCMVLTCQVYLVDTERGGLVRAPKSLELSFRPLQVDAWDNSSLLATTDLPGFHHSGQGGIEIKVSMNNQQDPGCVMQYTTKAKYLIRIAPVSDQYQTVEVLPLTLGPMEFKSYYHHHQQRQNGRLSFMNTTTTTNAIDWNMGGDTSNILRSDTTYRLYGLGTLLPFGSGSILENDALMDRYFIVREVWKLGTPGKIWDSALVLSDMFSKKIMQERTCFDGKHIIDLSAGTGCIGLLLGLLLRRLKQQQQQQPSWKLTLTDLPEALELIRENHRYNLGNTPDPHIQIEKLCWGNTRDAKQLIKRGGEPDIILASDVLYDPNCFGKLVETLKTLCVPGKTVIYLGYKRRGLKRDEENLFFDLAKANFQITTVNGNSLNNQHIEPVGWEKKYGFIKRNQSMMDGRGWLGPAGSDSDIFGDARQEGKVIIYRLVKKKIV
ncbi:putative methyltransferase-domain-containing protein [Circinella umbellata]|nr:putative methyltransferase-domain-containing protein [Circinella umbellata]